MLRSRMKPTVFIFPRYFAAVRPKESQVTREISENVSQFPIPFARAKLGSFYQEPPVLHNPFTEDALLQRFLKRHTANNYEEISKDLLRFGSRIKSEIEPLHHECEKNLPYLRPFSAWGPRQDRLVTCEAWHRQKEISAEEGLIAIGYDGTSNDASRLHQFAKLYLYCPSAGLYSCPLAMTDGAAKVIKELKLKGQTGDSFERLTSRDAKRFWTSGQWMTERKGGSDVAGGTETLAVPRPDGTYSLHGYKWFSSATDADMTLTLARCVNGDGGPTPGTKGLSLFFLPVKDPRTGKLNNIEIVRLKEKLGTRQVPTAELLLDGAIAHKVSDEGRGVASIAYMLNMTRLHNATASVAAMRRIVNLARDYAHRRKVFGKLLIDHPLHVQTLARMDLDTRACFLLTFEAVRLLGLQEHGKATDRDRSVFRLLMPIVKMYTAKQAVATVSEGLEAFGGMGYLEDTGLPNMFRDAQVLPIWEGTTNILALDVLRSFVKEGPGLFDAIQGDVSDRLKGAEERLTPLRGAAMTVREAVAQLVSFAQNQPQHLELAARDFAYSVAKTYCAVLLVEHAANAQASELDREAAIRWCQHPLVIINADGDVGTYNKESASRDRALLLEGYDNSISHS